MACSRPNLIGIGGPYENITFLGPRYQEKTLHDLGNRYENSVLHDIPCGKCQLCRVQRRYDRALRIMLEAECWPEATTFITLTFDEDHVGNNELDHKEWSQFMKDFRKAFCQAEYCKLVPKHHKEWSKVRTKTFKQTKQVMCGEYGDTFGRKHFHGIIFNHGFSDMRFTGEYSKKGNPIYTSDELAKVWKKGRVQVEKITFDLALYVGSYVTDALDDDDVNKGHTKKQYGLFGRGIGFNWIKKYWRDVLVAGTVQTMERDYPVPRYFWKKIEELQPEAYAAYKQKKYIDMKAKAAKGIEKGDGPLRRAQAKGRIFKHIHNKRKLDGSIN